MERGDLWKRGITDDLRLILRPPPQFSTKSSFNPEVISSVRKMQGDALKAISLHSSMEEMGGEIVQLIISKKKLSLRVTRLSKEKTELTKQNSELSISKNELVQTQEDLKKLREDFSVNETRWKEREEKVTALEAANAKLRADLEIISKEIEEAK